MRSWPDRITRATWPVLAGLLLGLVAGGIWTVAQPERHRAEARMLLRGPAASAAVPAVKALAESSLLEQNVAQTLRLSRPPRVSARAEEGRVLTLSVVAGSGERARQIDAEAAQVLTQLVDARFGPARVEATVLDPAHPVEQTSPTPLRNLLLCGLIGLALGVAAAVALARRRYVPAIAGAVDPNAERRLRRRIEEVAKRERALARRAGELAARESALKASQGELAGRESDLKRRESDVAKAVREPPPEPEVVPAPAPEPAFDPEPATAVTRAGAWNIHDLQHAVDARADASLEQAEEWRTYLFFLRQHAASDGSLPPQFDGLVLDVFGELLPG